jgi:hypothetical protein
MPCVLPHECATCLNCWLPRVSTVGFHTSTLRLREFQLLALRNFSEENHKVTDLSPRVPSLMDGLDLLRDFRAFGSLGLSNVKPENLRRKISEVNDLLPRVVADERSRFTSKIRASGVSNVKREDLPEENS